jgi:hypothetical protein
MPISDAIKSDYGNKARGILLSAAATAATATDDQRQKARAVSYLMVCRRRRRARKNHLALATHSGCATLFTISSLPLPPL